MKFPVTVLILLKLSAAKAEPVKVDCVFQVVSNLYTCQLADITVTENSNLFIGGQHLPGRTNNDVEVVNVVNSNIPFIITELFTTFPNLAQYRILAGGLTKINSGDFTNANKLRIFFASNNPKLVVLEEKAFVGASNLQSLELINSPIETLNEGAFSGLSVLVKLSVENALIREIPAEIFASLTQLQFVSLSNNRLESLSGKLFANNPRIRFLQFSNNQIKAIERNFFDNIQDLSSLNVQGNRCANQWFTVDIVRTIKLVKESLSECFNNFDYSKVGGRFTEAKRF